MTDTLPIRLFPQTFGLNKLAPTAEIPPAISRASPCFVARTSSELSIVAPRAAFVTSEGSFRLFGIDLVFGTTETGILKGVLDPLAEAEIWVLAIGTHDTDYVLVRADQVSASVDALERAGHRVIIQSPPTG